MPTPVHFRNSKNLRKQSEKLWLHTGLASIAGKAHKASRRTWDIYPTVYNYFNKLPVSDPRREPRDHPTKPWKRLFTCLWEDLRSSCPK